MSNQSIHEKIQRLSTEIVQQHNAKLIAVSKTFPESAIIEAYNAGMRRFGENYPQEFAKKAINLSKLHDIEWHFIGNIQSNKTKLIAEHAAYVHTLAKQNHAERLNNQRPYDKPPLNVLIEVNISQEANKHGVISLDELLALANFIQTQPRLQLRGLMCMASDTTDIGVIHTQFMQLAQYKNHLNQHGFTLTELSMGMSNDYHIALECGATFVRIGSKIFGARNYEN